ncbi:MAG: hypothetical protein QNJ34_03715 [Xenococcaceae cyanobacterium MO_188.B29]|nr:hypothetical protein [Xenococcaceae cyanobacterium MO_188.B29]
MSNHFATLLIKSAIANLIATVLIVKGCSEWVYYAHREADLFEIAVCRECDRLNSG